MKPEAEEWLMQPEVKIGETWIEMTKGLKGLIPFPGLSLKLSHIGSTRNKPKLANVSSTLKE